MSVQAISWALKQTIVERPTARHVLLCLANYAGESGKNAFPSVARLVTETGLSERSVRDNLRELEEIGAIRKGNQAITTAFIDRADRRPVVYDIALERGAPAAARSETGCTKPTNGGHLTTERGAPAAPDPSVDPSIDPSGAGSSFLTDQEKTPVRQTFNEFDFLSQDGTVFITEAEMAALQKECGETFADVRAIIRRACRTWLREVERGRRKERVIEWLRERAITEKGKRRTASPRREDREVGKEERLRKLREQMDQQDRMLAARRAEEERRRERTNGHAQR